MRLHGRRGQGTLSGPASGLRRPARLDRRAHPQRGVAANDRLRLASVRAPVQVEKLLAEVAGDDGASDPDTRARLLERVAVEVSRLSFQANRGKVRRGAQRARRRRHCRALCGGFLLGPAVVCCGPRKLTCGPAAVLVLCAGPAHVRGMFSSYALRRDSTLVVVLRLHVYTPPPAQELAFVRAMEPRIASARSTLQEALGGALRAALAGALHGPALHCMHAYAELGLTEPVEVRDWLGTAGWVGGRFNANATSWASRSPSTRRALAGGQPVRASKRPCTHRGGPHTSAQRACKLASARNAPRTASACQKSAAPLS